MHVPASFLAHTPVLRQAKHTCGSPFLSLPVPFPPPPFEETSHAREMILHGLFSVSEVFLAPDKVVDKFPATSVGADRIVNDAVVPK